MSCHVCDPHRGDPYYVFNSTILTIVITAAAFIVAFAWNQVSKACFDTWSSKEQMIHSMFTYAFVVTLVAIILCFLLYYYLNGEKY